MKIKSKSALSIILTVFLISICTTVYASISVIRTDSDYSTICYSYASYMQNKMNCYGYASHFYYPNGGYYKQQPGEFAHNEEEFGSWNTSGLMRSYYYAMTSWNNLNDFVKDRIFEDYESLDSVDDEFDIYETTRVASVSSGQRKIAMSIRQDGINSDYHFYLRHSDGTWSHKPGSSSITNLSLDTSVIITDDNIEDKSQEGNYDDGTRYFMINKSVVIDFPHNYGQYLSTEYTITDFRDMAGDCIQKSYTIYNDWNSRFDYPEDIDFFEFTPTSSGYYYISTDRGAGYDIDGAVFDDDGDVIILDNSYDNASFYLYLEAYSTYYIDMYDYNENVGYYTLLCHQ